MNRKHWSPDHPAVMYWSDIANLTHETQVQHFGFCTCEEQEEFPYDDCPRTLQQRTDAVVQRHRARKAQHRPDWAQRLNTLTGFLILLGLLPLLLVLDEHNVPPLAGITVLFGGLTLAVLIMSESHRDDLP